MHISQSERGIVVTWYSPNNQKSAVLPHGMSQLAARFSFGELDIQTTLKSSLDPKLLITQTSASITMSINFEGFAIASGNNRYYGIS
jgi:hypothetical protein